jgi:two-component system sensor histidine kinase UhpB
VLDQFGLADALEDLAERTRRSQPQVQLALEVSWGSRVLARPALALYRAAQEGITNALRHGGARSLRVTLRSRGRSWCSDVVDDGSGLGGGATTAPGHYGLRWLAERVEALGGSLQLADAQPHGVRLVVRVPLPAAGAAA